MKIAVTYHDGEIFQHFGRTEEFKLYEIEDNKVVSSEVIGSNGAGHGALAVLLAENEINALICGGLGGGAQAALADAGIEVISGVQGDPDQAVAAYLAGELESQGVNCDHHDHHHEEGHSCGCGSHGEEEAEEASEEDCGGSCGGGCGSSCGGCGGNQIEIILEGKNAGKRVKTHYTGTFNDGTKFDSSYDRGEPLEFISGAGMMIPGFDKAVVNMEVGETVTVHLMPEEAYGLPDPRAIMTLAIAELQGAEDLNVGDRVYLSNGYGQQFPVTVTAKDETNITLDANHEMAGKELNFTIELVDVE